MSLVSQLVENTFCLIDLEFGERIVTVNNKTRGLITSKKSASNVN